MNTLTFINNSVLVLGRTGMGQTFSGLGAGPFNAFFLLNDNYFNLSGWDCYSHLRDEREKRLRD